MMKVDKALKEVWDWKDAIYEETKHLSMHERVKHIRKGADALRKKYKLKFKKSQN